MNTINSMNPENVGSSKYFLITIDVEDWFQVENFKPWIAFETWHQRELRVERNVNRLLDLFDSVKLDPPGPLMGRSSLNAARRTGDRGEQYSRSHTHNEIEPFRNNKNSRPVEHQHTRQVQATFFILGWIAERLPGLVREIRNRGHEVASHGYNHDLPSEIPRKKLGEDLTQSKKKLEDITGALVCGYRSPSFAVNDDTLNTIRDSGFHYDSSYNSFSLHGRYGKISTNGFSRNGIARQLAENFYELPISNLMINRRIVPWGGGAYFRLIPYRLFRLGVQEIQKKDQTYLFYVHPWEIDPEQPKVNAASLNNKFRHYTNLKSTHKKLRRMIIDFRSSLFITCDQFIRESENSRQQNRLNK